MANIPLTVEDITEKWIEKVLAKSLNAKKIQVLTIQHIKTEGFLSNAVKSTVRIDNGDPIKLFIKVSLPSENDIQSYVSDYGLDEIELKAYKEILPELIKFENQSINASTLHDMIPRVNN